MHRSKKMNWGEKGEALLKNIEPIKIYFYKPKLKLVGVGLLFLPAGLLILQTPIRC